MATTDANGHVPSETKPITLMFNNLKVDLGEKTILDNVSGFVNPGEVLAVMGPSGSGKTTLLNCLAGRKVGDAQSGEVLLNGHHITKKLKRKICYVLQDDLFFDNLTLRETLTYSALLRLPDKMPKHEKHEKVNEIIDILDLEKCANTKIGNSISRGLSGGEKKRANIGCELITNPSLILLDEPTSGLDSNNAYNLVKTLETFAVKKSKTVVMTIHQPSSQIFYLFDKLLLMANGKVMYYGKASEVLDFFDGAGFHCEEHFNPADYILEVVSRGEEVEGKIVAAFKRWTKGVLPPAVCDDQDTKEQSSDMAAAKLDYGLQNMAMNVSDDLEKTGTELDSQGEPRNTHLQGAGTSSATLLPLHPVGSVRGCSNVPLRDIRVEVDEATNSETRPDHEEKWPTSFWTQFTVLSHRTFKQSRSQILSKLVLTQNMLLAVITGLLWFQLPHKEETIQDRRGLLFFFIIYWSINPMFRALLTFPSEEVIIKKERSAGSYRLSSYFFAKWSSEVPLVICQPLLFLFIFYWMCGLSPTVAFLGQALNLIFSTILSQSLGLAIGATVMTFDKAIVIAAVTVLTALLLGGFYIKNVPFWLEWMRFLSFITYSYENTLILEFTGIKEHSCGPIKTNYLSCKNNGTIITGEEILDDMEIQRTFGENLAIILAFIIALRSIAYCSLRFLHKPA